MTTTNAWEALTQLRALCDTEMALADTSAERLILARIRAVLDAVAVDATPPQDIEREVRIILNLLVASGSIHPEDVKVATDAILALVRPVEGVALSREEVRLLVSTLHRTDEWHAVHLATLVAQLEATTEGEPE